MNKLVSHAYHGSPRYLGMAISEILRDSTCCLTKNLKIVDNRVLCLFLPIKLTPSALCVFDDFDDCFLNVLYPVECICHRGTASFKTRCRMRLLRPFSVTMSTLCPSRSWRSIRSSLRSKSVRPGS